MGSKEVKAKWLTDDDQIHVITEIVNILWLHFDPAVGALVWIVERVLCLHHDPFLPIVFGSEPKKRESKKKTMSPGKVEEVKV